MPPGRYAVSALPLGQCVKVQLGERERRAYEASAKRDLLRMETAEDVARARAERIATLDSEAARSKEAAEETRRAAALRRSEKEMEALRVWAPDDSRDNGDEGGGQERYQLVVRRVAASNRMSKNDLPDELAVDAEAVEVWQAAIEMKRRGGQVLEKWVRGWRMRMVPRQTVSGHDLYIKAPDMKPEVMPAKHLTSKEAIRSFTALVDKLRERLESGASSGADAAAPPVRATCYFTPANGRVALELHVVARPSVGTASSAAEAEAEAEAE